MSGMTVPVHEKLPRRTEPTNAINVGNIDVRGNVDAPITIGNNNIVYSFVSHTEHGVVVNLEAPPSIKRRDLKPQPPRIPRGFVGRENELQDLERLIRGHEAVWLHGHDGIGKTTLVKEAANHEAALSLPDGVFYMEAIGEENLLGFQDILQSMFDALFESNPPLKMTTATAQVHLGNTKPLIILDNIGLPTESLNQLPDILSKGGLIVTSRDAQLDDIYLSVEISPLAHRDAMQLLIEKSGVESDSNSLPLIDRICTLLADTPLAIAKIGKLIYQKRLSLSSAAEKLEVIDPPSQNKIQAAIERSFGLIYTVLNRDEREMLTATAAAPGLSVDRPWLESVAGGETVSNSLESLELLQANSPRLRLHDDIKQILKPAGNDFRGLLLEHFVSELPNRQLDFGYVTDELGNILGLIQWAASEGRWSNVITLGKAVDPYLTAKGLWDVWERILRLVLIAAENLNDLAVRAWALHQLGSREIGIGKISQATQYLKDALDIRESIGDGNGAAYTLHNLRLILPPGNNGPDRKGPPNAGGTIPPDGPWWILWVRDIRYWLSENPRWFFPILFGGLLLIAILIAALYDIFNNPLELTVQAERLLYIDPSNDAIQYTYSIRNKNTSPLLGPLKIASGIFDSVDCPIVNGESKSEQPLGPGETITCKSIYKIVPADREKGSVTDRAQARSSENQKSKWVSTTTALEPSAPTITLSIIPDVTEYDQNGQEIKYSYTITNTGNIILRIPAEIEDNMLTATCDSAGDPNENAEYLYPDKAITCFADYKITQSDLNNESMTNTAVATIDGIKSNEASFTINAHVHTGLKLTTTVDTESYETVGQTITYTYTVENTGNTIRRQLPTITSNLIPEPCMIANLNGNEGIQPQEQATCTSTYVITQNDLDNGMVINNASVTVSDYSSANSTTTITANKKPALTLSSTANPNIYSRVGDVITYIYTVSNAGNVTLDSTQLKVTDEQIGGTNPIPCVKNQNTLPPNGTESCTATRTIVLTDIDAKSITNKPTATITYEGAVISSPAVSTTVTFKCPGPPSGWVPYIAQSGNTLSQISRAYNIASSVLQEANCMGSSTVINRGQKFYVPYLVSIQGLVFYDSNGNGVQDPGENGISDFKVSLEDGNGNTLGTTTTGNGGNYLFSNFLPGSYWVYKAQVTFINQTQGIRNFGLVPVPAY